MFRNLKVAVMIVLVLLVVLVPQSVFASSCSRDGYTITTINGVFSDEVDAKKNSDALKYYFDKTYKGEKLTVDFLLNPSHLGGIGDILKSAYQGIFDKETVNDYDLTEMIKAASGKVRTQKLLLVAHSQGNFYANSFYDSIAGKSGGVPTESIGVYGVATPASRVAGGGKWLTSDTDKVIAGVVGRVPFKSIMAPNTHIELSDGDDALGHNFTDIYLKYRAGQIVSDIESSLNNLKANNTQNDNEPCIAPPKITIVHKVESVMFAVADPVANVGVSAVSNTVSGTYYAGKVIVSVAKKVAQKTADIAVKTAEKVKSAAQKTTATIKDAFSDKRFDQMATANIGQAVEDLAVSDQQLVASDGQQEIISSMESVRNEDSLISLLSQNDNQTEIALPLAPLEARNNTPIHAPYQWPEEVIHAPYAEGDAHANNGFLADLRNGGSQPVFVSADGEGPSQSLSASGGSYSLATSLSQNDGEEIQDNASTVISEEAETQTQDENSSNEEVIPETLQEQSQEQLEELSQEDRDIIPAETSIQTQDEDYSGEEAAPEAPQPELPQQPATPDIQFYLTDYSVRSKNFKLSWEDANNIVQSWELQYKMAPNFEWAELANSSSLIAGNYPFIAQYDDITYYFRLRGQDASGNPTEWKTLQADISTKPVAINEIAWMGTEASPYDEWVELANKTNQEIDLNGWILKTTDGNADIKLTGKIAPNGFYLLERAIKSEMGTADEDSTVANIVADQIYTSRFLVNREYQNEPGQNMILQDKDNNEIDNIWTLYAGDNNGKRTSERVNIWSNSLFKNNWQNYIGEGGEAQDADSNKIYGTPKSANSVIGAYPLNSGVFEGVPQITQETIFLKDRGPYMANGPTEIRGAKAYVEPGTKFEFSSFGFIGFHDDGELIAKGTGNEKIYIKSSNSSGIALYLSNGAKGELDNMEIEGGMVRINTAIIKISNSSFKNGSYGFLDLLNGSEFDISNSEFDGNNYGDAIVIKQSQGKIYSNNIKNNRGNGIYIDSLSGVLDISGNSFSGNSYPIATDGFIDFDLSGNIFDNGVYELLVYNPVVDSGEVATISNKMSYILYDRAKDSDWYKVGDPEIKVGGTLKIEPGAVIKFNNNSLLEASGRLEAVGTAESPIVFKYLWDYASYEDIKSVVAGEIDSSKYIQFSEGSEYVIENAITRESGDSGYQSYWLMKE